MKIRPKEGVQLAGIPAEGADVDDELAQEWLDAGLVDKVKKIEPAPEPAPEEG